VSRFRGGLSGGAGIRQLFLLLSTRPEMTLRTLGARRKGPGGTARPRPAPRPQSGRGGRDRARLRGAGYPAARVLLRMSVCCDGVTPGLGFWKRFRSMRHIASPSHVRRPERGPARIPDRQTGKTRPLRVGEIGPRARWQGPTGNAAGWLATPGDGPSPGAPPDIRRLVPPTPGLETRQGSGPRLSRRRP
jgi:hypothetical protein